MRSVPVCIMWGMWGMLACSAVARAQATAAIAEHAPASACLALVSADVGKTCVEFQQTRLGQTLTGQSFGPLLAELRQRQLGGPLHLRPIVGFDWSDLQNVHSAGGLFVFPLADGELGLAWIFAGVPAAGNEGPLAAAAAYFGEQGFRGERIDKPPATLTIYRPPASRQDESPRVLWVADGFHGVANSPAAVDVLLNGTRGASLASDPIWQQRVDRATAAAPRPGDVYVWVRPLPLWERLRAAASAKTNSVANAAQRDDDEAERDPVAASKRLGFDGLQVLAGTVCFSPAETFEWRIDLHLVAPPPYAKALRMLTLQAGPQPELPEMVAASASSFSFWRWDFSTAMQGFGNLFDEANEPGPSGEGLFDDMLDGLRDDPEGVQVDLRREVFAQLGPDIFLITDRQGAKSERWPSGARALYVVEVRDRPSVASALTRFYAGDDRVTHVREQGYDIWTVPEGASLFVEGESASVVSVRALGLGERRLLFGTDEALLRATLAGVPTSDRLKTDVAWADLWQALQPAATDSGGLWSLARLDQVLEPGYAQAIAEPAADEEPVQELGPVARLWRLLLFGAIDPRARVPLAAAPPFERVRPALPRTGTAWSPAADGWQIKIGPLRRQEQQSP